ncbi:MAG: thymidylate synthase, partial [archaeon]
MKISAKTYAELYNELITKLLGYPEYVNSPRDQKVNEITNVTMHLTNPLSNMFKNTARDIPKKYLAAELLWYFSGRNDLEFIKNYSSFWEKIANKDNTLNSAYGNLIFNKRDSGDNESQWKWAYDSLAKDRDTRQAILHFNRPEHQLNGNKDFVCTLNGMFLIRDNK